MKLHAIVIPAVLIFALAGCAPEPGASPPLAPSASPTATPSPTSTPSPSGTSLVLPFGCDELVPTDVIHTQFSSSFESIYFAADLGDDAAQSFASRLGLTCLWGIPQSDAGFVKVFAAERDTDTDEQQVAIWRSAGYTDCSPFLDACYVEDVLEEGGEVWTVHALVGGFELRVFATSTSIEPLLATAREAAKNMGHR